MTVEKASAKVIHNLLWPITTGANCTINQSEFLAVACKMIKLQEKSCVQVTIILWLCIGLGFASCRLKNWHEIFKPIIKCGNCNNWVIIFTLAKFYNKNIEQILHSKLHLQFTVVLSLFVRPVAWKPLCAIIIIISNNIQKHSQMGKSYCH